MTPPNPSLAKTRRAASWDCPTNGVRPVAWLEAPPQWQPQAWL